MIKKIKLKNKKPKNRIKIFITTILILIVFSLICVFFIGKKISNKIMKYSEIQIIKISKLIVNNAVTDTFTGNTKTDDLFNITKNDNGDIQTIDFDTIVVNKILSGINERIIKMFNDLENGKSDIINLERNLITNTYLVFKNNGIIMEIPIGIVTNNSILNNIGPKIPVKISLSGELESCVSTKVENYGINNAVMNVYINIEVSEQIILPLTTKKVTISNTIPVMVKMIQGKIPNYYSNGINSNSGMLSIPIENSNLQN